MCVFCVYVSVRVIVWFVSGRVGCVLTRKNGRRGPEHVRLGRRCGSRSLGGGDKKRYRRHPRFEKKTERKRKVRTSKALPSHLILIFFFFCCILFL